MTIIVDARAIPRFGYIPTIDGGADVICEDDGRAVAHRDTIQSANGVAFYLNNVANDGGSTALVRALGRLR